MTLINLKMLKYFLLIAITNITHVIATEYEDINRFVFSPSEDSKLLNGCSTTRCDLENIGMEALLDQDTFLNLAVYADRRKGEEDGKCFSSANQCSSNYTVTYGEVGITSGVFDGNLPAYQVSPRKFFFPFSFFNSDIK